MKKFNVQFTVSLEVAKTISADSLDDALAYAKASVLCDPVEQGLIKIGKGIEYLWNNETVATGVSTS